ncbi:MAG TPA: hypothetical protein VNX68_15805, partial [Nitrosopumilaceae archaeon]|nr:hypothetical protein [Nitrosopumilaceae archaeon]
MVEVILYNGKQFPDYIFYDKVLGHFFLEFDFIYTEEFWDIFKKFLEDNNIKKILIENLQPDYLFVDEINVKDLPMSFMDSVCTEKLEGYFPSKASLYMISLQALIYSKENKELFCIYLDREFSLAIFGFCNQKDVTFFNEIGIKNLTDYLTMTFAGNEIPGSFNESL